MRKTGLAMERDDFLVFFRWRGLLGSTDSLFAAACTLLRALCAGEQRASIGVAVHRFGKCAKVFLKTQVPRKSGAACCATLTETKIRAKGLRFLFDLGLYFSGYVAEDFYGDGIFAEGFDGFTELDLALIDLEALRGESFGDVAGGDGAEQLVVLAGLAGEAHGDAVDERGLLLRGFELSGGFLGERVADA